MPKAIVANGIPTQQVSRPTDTPKLAAIYARVSTAEQADKGYSLPTQLDACQGMARQEGYTVPNTHVFVDDYTGMSLNRPQFTPLRDLVRQRLVQAVFVYDLDRLSRKLAHQLLLSEEFEQAGVALRIVTMPDGAKTPETQLLSNVRGIIAECERAKILERTARGRRGRAQAGHVTYGRRTLPALVWHPSTIVSILRNTTYVGTQYEGKTQSLPGKKNPDKKTRVRRMPREAWIPIAVPP